MTARRWLESYSARRTVRPVSEPVTAPGTAAGAGMTRPADWAAGQIPAAAHPLRISSPRDSLPPHLVSELLNLTGLANHGHRQLVLGSLVHFGLQAVGQLEEVGAIVGNLLFLLRAAASSLISCFGCCSGGDAWGLVARRGIGSRRRWRPDPARRFRMSVRARPRLRTDKHAGERAKP